MLWQHRHQNGSAKTCKLIGLVSCFVFLYVFTTTHEPLSAPISSSVARCSGEQSAQIDISTSERLPADDKVSISADEKLLHLNTDVQLPLMENFLGDNFFNLSDPYGLWKQQLYHRLDGIRLRCGVLCAINNRSVWESLSADVGKIFKEITAHVECKSIMLDENLDASDNSVPFPFPSELEKYYSMHGEIPIQLQRYSNVYLGGKQKQAVGHPWSEEYVSSFANITDGTINIGHGTYGESIGRNLLEHLRSIEMRNKRMLVIGSEYPWIEAIGVLLGADVTTLEFGEIESTHPQIRTFTPKEFRQQYKDGKLLPFHVIVTYSSLEHTGLGRYGDALNPWGDLLAVAKAWCVTEDGGYLFISVPAGTDGVLFNGHRLYGKLRYPMLTANWELYNSSDYKDAKPFSLHQPVLVFKKKTSSR